MSPTHGRALIYVWAAQQDELSKRSIPSLSPSDPNITTTCEDGILAKNADSRDGTDVFVPWVLSSQNPSTTASQPEDQNKTYNRYYHMFDKGELRNLVRDAAEELGIFERARTEDANPKETETIPTDKNRFVEFVQDDWERSNYYVELLLWSR